MAVTVQGSTIRMTAQADEVSMPLVVKSFHWSGATTVGHLLEITEDSTLGSTSNRLHADSAAGANYQGIKLMERYYPKGIRLNDMDSGEVFVVYS